MTNWQDQRDDQYTFNTLEVDERKQIRSIQVSGRTWLWLPPPSLGPWHSLRTLIRLFSLSLTLIPIPSLDFSILIVWKWCAGGHGVQVCSNLLDSSSRLTVADHWQLMLLAGLELGSESGISTSKWQSRNLQVPGLNVP